MVTAVRRCDLVALPEARADPDGSRLLADRQVNDADELTAPVQVGQRLLEASDPHHRSEPVRAALLENALAAHTLILPYAGKPCKRSPRAGELLRRQRSAQLEPTAPPSSGGMFWLRRRTLF